MRTLRLLAPLVGALFLLPQSVAAQSRADLLRQAATALDDFDAARAIRFARAALNPQLGPLDSTWTRGVHVLTQILIEEQRQPLAATWAQWALRQQPDLQIDSVNFLSNVVTTLREARVAAVRSTADDATRTTYEWPGTTTDAGESRFRIASGGPPLTVLVRGIGLVGAQGLVLPPGTYELEVNATGFLPLRVTREALPGVTSEFAFTLTSAAAAAEELAADVAARVARATRPLQVARFGMPQACAAGLASGGERLVLTSYHAIRGADAITANGEVRVAAYDVAANLAVLMLPAAAPDTLASTAQLLDGQSLWGVTLADCQTAAPTQRVVLEQWEGRPLGALLLSNAPLAATLGSPLVDYQGNLAGVWTAGGRAAPASVIAPLLARAKENVAANRTMTAQQVATQENHRYGSVVIAVDMPNATVKVTPLEAWQWQELRAEGPAPFTFRGAAGRYRVEVSAPNVSARTQEVTLRAGETVRTAISLRAVAQGPAPAAAPRRGVPKWVWAVAIGGAVGGALALGGGGGGGGSSGGTIVIEVPNP